jgi:hypothetical protein
MTGPNRQAAAARAAALGLAIALVSAGCASSDPASTGTVALSSGNGNGSGSGSGGVPATAYVSVVENYFPEGAASRAPGSWQLKYAVTNEQTITKLAKLINALPTAPNQNIEIPCTSSMAPAYKLDFQDSQGASPVAEVSIECFGVMVTLRGHDEPIRSDSVPPGEASFLQNVAALLAGSMPQAK